MAYRKGLVLQFGMVTTIVSLDGATTKEESLTVVCCGTPSTTEHVPTPITQKRYCKTCGEVQYADLKKAREVGSGQYQIADQQEIASVRDASQGATKKMLTLTVHDAAEVAERTIYTDGVYLVSPDGAAQVGAYSLLLDAVQRHPDKVFLTRYTVTSSVGTYQLKAFNGQLALARLVDPENVKSATFTEAIEPDQALRDQMDMVLDKMVTTFDPAEYENSYAKNLADLLASKEAVSGEVAEKRQATEKSVSTAGVVDLSAQLAAMLGTPEVEKKGKVKSA